ncbi:glycoside hydrolase family 43 [Pseudarthrobacter chlorophenolicus A6]|uniref:Glycoside hydrolase family 43 n=1 Tax=Pseudarthrobacter chlorophenolicus (strain ATCC 700700 / DSM 12829 / CIP 107037 / JCM 12360 / KCTC 9906 / NCIMB 13794 / A6) TaxID=452863 RepID=B8H6G1_PSECP|nr:family 43 glycosylhydrolase [Pseudarthrobacter chlorophenolicus]ACL41487.1 glycoside hydrolase family 43 [Pseudarthrobacter chlorophenolicus A6]SDQ63303.1 xylan 1,4-beta-xylosidase [Pseudarthrobacter chlorophenolicus]
MSPLEVFTEGQRRADLGDGSYLNPVFAGDHPDPAILRDGDDYYLTFSSFESTPGLIIWHSTDLLNWRPLGPALPTPIGNVFAVDMCKVDGRYYIYVPVIPTSVSPDPGAPAQIYVIHAESMAGPWSEPVNLGINGHIDPGHVVGEDGNRYLFLSGVSRVRLSPDGLSTDGPLEHVYDGWRYPDDWVTEAYALEGPKLAKRGEWFYLTTAVGGTSGPPTGHMVTVARSRSVLGPWEDCPANPIIRTWDVAEPWWSKGHATLFEGPGGQWWSMYHAYENGFTTLGRQTLLEPIEWDEHGWPRAAGGDLSKALPAPVPGASAAGGTGHGIQLSDDFAEARFGIQWSFHAPAKDEYSRVSIDDGLVLAASGSDPSDSSPLTCIVGEQRYEVTVEAEFSGGAQGGLLLYYSDRLFCGMGHDGDRLWSYRAGKNIPYWREPAPAASTIHFRMVNDAHIVTQYYSTDGINWTRHGLRYEMSGYNTNTAGELLSLRPALFATGSGQVRFRNFQYRVIED